MALLTPVFISYRREDSASEARYLNQLLRSKLDENSVFFDVSSINPGETWPNKLRENLKNSKTFIVVIGPNWLKIADKWGRRRLDSEEDWVRNEIELALKEEKEIIPVLIGGAEMPPPEALPEELRPLPDKQIIDIRRDYFEQDVKLLISQFYEKDKSHERGLAVDVAAALSRQMTLCKEQNLKFRSSHLVAALLSLSSSFTLSCLEWVKSDYVTELSHRVDNFLAHQGDKAAEHGFEDFKLEEHPTIKKAFNIAADEGENNVDERHVLLAFLGSPSSLNKRIKKDLGDIAYNEFKDLVKGNRPGAPEVGLSPYGDLFD